MRMLRLVKTVCGVRHREKTTRRHLHATRMRRGICWRAMTMTSFWFWIVAVWIASVLTLGLHLMGGLKGDEDE